MATLMGSQSSMVGRQTFPGKGFRLVKTVEIYPGFLSELSQRWREWTCSSGSVGSLSGHQMVFRRQERESNAASGDFGSEGPTRGSRFYESVNRSHSFTDVKGLTRAEIEKCGS